MSISDEPKKSSYFFCKLPVLCVLEAVGRFWGKGGHLLLPPHPPTALPWQCYKPTLVYKKKVTRFCLAHHLWTSLYIIWLFFQDREMLSHINGNLSQRTFKKMMLLNTGLSWKVSKIRIPSLLVAHPKQVHHSLKRLFLLKRVNFLWHCPCLC